MPSVHKADQPGNTASKTVETVKIVTAWYDRYEKNMQLEFIVKRR